MNDTQKNPGKRSRAARIVFTLACVVTLIALFYAEEDWRGWHKWNQFEQSWLAKGEHFDIASIVPPPVPDDQNFAMTPIAVSSYGYVLTHEGKAIPSAQRDTNFVIRMHMPVAHQDHPPTDCEGDRLKGTFTRLDVWQNYYRAQAAQTNEFAVPASPGKPAQDVLLALRKYDSQIAELRAACQLPESRFPIDYDNESPWAILLPHLAQFKSCALLLQLRSVAELQNGQSDKALDDIRLTLQLADKIRNEPIMISQLVRIAMVQLLLQSVWEGLAQHKWSEAQLATLETELAKLDFVSPWPRAMHGELGGQTGEMDLIRRRPERMQDVAESWDFEGNTIHNSLPLGILNNLIPSGWFYQNEYYCVRLTREYYVPIANVAEGTFSPDLVTQGEALLAKETASGGIYNRYERIMVPALANCAKKFAYGQASVNLARTAIALERYWLAHHEYPDALGVLSPEFLLQVPHDVIGGQPLKYRREENGQFVLYSIGWNKTDDGGVTVFGKGSPPKINLQEGDWVWSGSQK